MTRTVTHSNLSTPAARARLKPNPKPFWQAIDPGLDLGYRKGAVGGKWAVRVYLGVAKYQLTTFAIADDHVAADGERVMSHAQAKRRALNMAAIPAVGPTTVSDALESHFAWAEQKGGMRVDEDRHRAKRHILPGLGEIPVDALTTAQLDVWLAGLARGNGDDSRRASRASANRVLTILKAALNCALKDKTAAPSAEWANCKPFPDVNQPRIRFFDRDEITRLLNAAGRTDFGDLCRAALFTGCRYGELMRLLVADFEPDSGTIRVAESKSGKPRRVHLTGDGRKFFEGLVADRPRDALILTRDGRAWRATGQALLKTKAMAAARVEKASFHCWRKTAASHWVMGGVDLQAVARNLGHSDSKLTESGYDHLAPSYRSEQMRKAPDFGTTPDQVVVPVKVSS